MFQLYLIFVIKLNQMNFFLIFCLPATIWAQNNMNCTTFGNYDYIFGRNASTYDIASDKCNLLGAKLAAIKNETIYDHIAEFIQAIKRMCFISHKSKTVASDSAIAGREFSVRIEFLCCALGKTFTIPSCLFGSWQTVLL